MTGAPKRLEGGDPIVALGVAELGRAFAAGDASPRHACELYLNRIARHDAAIGAFVAVDADRARGDAAASARRWSRGEARSPIDGVPLGVKANIAVRGLAWTAGIGAWRDRIATHDAACVERLRDAGAVILGTLNMDAGALGAMTDNPWFGRTRNPHRPGHSAGGSSGGPAAAVAAGLCAAALGTDTMGSVRIPAAACGVYGLVPPVEAIDRGGIVPLAPSFDRVGILARSIADLHAVLGVFVPSSDRASHDGPLAVFDATMDGSVRRTFDDLATRMAAAGRRSVVADLHDHDARRMAHALLLLVEVEGAVVHRDLLVDDPEGLGTNLASLLRWGASLTAGRRAEAARDLASARATIDTALLGHRGLLSPTTPHPALAFDGAIRKDTACFTAMASIAGLPALALPLAGDDDGLPHSVQVVGRTTAEVLRIGRDLEPCLVPVPSPPAFAW